MERNHAVKQTKLIALLIIRRESPSHLLSQSPQAFHRYNSRNQIQPAILIITQPLTKLTTSTALSASQLARLRFPLSTNTLCTHPSWKRRDSGLAVPSSILHAANNRRCDVPT